MIKISLNQEQIERAERMLSHVPDAIPKAMANAINRAADTAKTEASRKIRKIYYIKHKEVIETIRIYGAKETDLNAVVISKGERRALSKFKITPKKPQPGRRKPVIARVKRGGGGPISYAFVAKVQHHYQPKGHIGVFKRASDNTKRVKIPVRVGDKIREKKVKELPIQQLYGPSVPQMMNNPEVKEWVEEKASERLEQRLEHEINRILRR
ncbi:MAG: phage tail protein [Desulfotomaculum sp.]|nr:phage tail protein [Desulfotomaculum sp.]